MATNNEKWRYTSPDWYKTDKDILKVWLRLAEDTFNALYEEDKANTDRLFSVIRMGALLILAYGAIAFGNNSNSVLIFGSKIGGIIALIAMLLCFNVLRPRKLPSPGSEPKYSMSYDVEGLGDTAYHTTMILEIMQVQEKIDIILLSNRKRIRRIRIIYYVFMISPVAGFISALVLNIL